MKNNNQTILLIIVVFSALLQPLSSFAQGGQGPRRDPGQMVAAEKKIILDSIDGLNEEQKLIINEIYKDYEQSMTTMRANADPDNREAMMSGMTTIREGKNESLKAILTEAQYIRYESLMKAVREQMGQRRRREGE